MDCTLNESLVCTVCGRHGKAGRRQMCQSPCAPRCGKQPDLLTCPVCRGPLKKRKRPPELAAWWFWCRACDTFVRECRDCNRKAAGS